MIVHVCLSVTALKRAQFNDSAQWFADTHVHSTPSHWTGVGPPLSATPVLPPITPTRPVDGGPGGFDLTPGPAPLGRGGRLRPLQAAPKRVVPLEAHESPSRGAQPKSKQKRGSVEADPRPEQIDALKQDLARGYNEKYTRECCRVLFMFILMSMTTEHDPLRMHDAFRETTRLHALPESAFDVQRPLRVIWSWALDDGASGALDRAWERFYNPQLDADDDVGGRRRSRLNVRR